MNFFQQEKWINVHQVLPIEFPETGEDLEESEGSLAWGWRNLRGQKTPPKMPPFPYQEIYTVVGLIDYEAHGFMGPLYKTFSSFFGGGNPMRLG